MCTGEAARWDAVTKFKGTGVTSTPRAEALQLFSAHLPTLAMGVALLRVGGSQIEACRLVAEFSR